MGSPALFQCSDPNGRRLLAFGMAAINTGKVGVGPGKARELHFSNIDEMLADMDRLLAAERAGTLERLGNWTPGQIFDHLATWIDYAFDGYPPSLRPPWIVRFIVGFQKSKFIRGPMPRGVRIPGISGGTLATDVVPLDEGAAHLRRSAERLKREKPTQKNVLFGEMTHQEWTAMNLRHAELHMSFLRPA